MIGILGGGQLAQMLAEAGNPLGLRFRVLDPAPDAPAAIVAEHYQADFNDPSALDAFADGVELVTYEFENVPVQTAHRLENHAPVFPPARALEVAQDRLAEKSMFRELGIPTPEFIAVDSLEDLNAALDKTGLPAVLKTRRLGYDGKGQVVVKDRADAASAWESLGKIGLILEAFVPFDRELSILAVRGRDSTTAFYPLVENHHRGGILRTSIAPAPADTPALEQAARSLAKRILEKLGYVGVLAIELFQVNGQLLANEIAPRVHNSGHWTIEGSIVSQFENHIRAVCGLPLGSTNMTEPVTMLNLIGGVPPKEEILSLPGVHLHLYGKEPRPGRKVGHITVRHSVIRDDQFRELAQLVKKHEA